MTRQPKHTDIDHPRGYLKRWARRWLRHVIRRETCQAITEALYS
jgi:hypothetical protein